MVHCRRRPYYATTSPGGRRILQTVNYRGLIMLVDIIRPFQQGLKSKSFWLTCSGARGASKQSEIMEGAAVLKVFQHMGYGECQIEYESVNKKPKGMGVNWKTERRIQFIDASAGCVVVPELYPPLK